MCWQYVVYGWGKIFKLIEKFPPYKFPRKIKSNRAKTKYQRIDKKCFAKCAWVLDLTFIQRIL